MTRSCFFVPYGPGRTTFPHGLEVHFTSSLGEVDGYRYLNGSHGSYRQFFLFCLLVFCGECLVILKSSSTGHVRCKMWLHFTFTNAMFLSFFFSFFLCLTILFFSSRRLYLCMCELWCVLGFPKFSNAKLVSLPDHLEQL